MLTIDALRDYGANVDEGLSRCMDNEGFYLKMVNMVFADTSLEKLKAALAANDLDAAFEAAHAFKGVTGNLSLTPLNEPVVEITELLRSRTEMDFTDLMQKIDDQWNRLVARKE